MTTRETRSGAALILALEGRLDGFSAPTLEERVTQLLAEEVRHIVFDCSGLEYISSSGLRLFLFTAKQLQKAGGRCAFAALSPAVQNLFRISNFLELLEIHPTVAHACA